jgi:hypothetical protein
MACKLLILHSQFFHPDRLLARVSEELIGKNSKVRKEGR